jgi:hypothetical protein
MFNELKDTTGLPVDIIGINERNQLTDARMYLAKPLSWLRDTDEVKMQVAWGAAYRDLVILDPLNQRVQTFNLTPGVDDLSVAANYTRVKNALIAAAVIVDSDNDGLPDYWEEWAVGDRTRNANSLMPDGRKLLLHYAHAAAERSGGLPGLPRMVGLLNGTGGTLPAVIWRGRRVTAGGLTLLPEFSANLLTWTGTTDYEEYSRRPLYDGSGGEVIEWRSVLAQPVPFVRVRATLPP